MFKQDAIRRPEGVAGLVIDGYEFGKVRRTYTVDTFEGEYEYFELDPRPNGQPVQFAKDRCHVAEFRGSSGKSGGCVLDPLQFLDIV